MVNTEPFRYKGITSLIFSRDLVPPDPPATQVPIATMSESASPAAEQLHIVLSPVKSRPGNVATVPDEERVEKVLKKIQNEYGDVRYVVRFGDGGEYPVSTISLDLKS